MTEHLKVLIVGGGIGGLALASGLGRRGIEAVVLERDTDPARTAGYHLHVNATARAALESVLEPSAFERVLASAESGRWQGGNVVRDMRGRTLTVTHEDDEASAVNIDRIALRLILSEAVGGALRLGTTVTGFSHGPEGVEVRLADGSTLQGDVLVGAEGVGSPIARELAGGPTSLPVGLIGVGGRTAAGDLDEDAAAVLGRRSGLAVGPRGTGLYIGYHDPAGRPALHVSGAVPPVSAGPVLIWGAVLAESPSTEALRNRRGDDLRDATSSLLAAAGWSARMRSVIDRSEPESVAGFRFSASPTEPARLAPWPAGAVTAIGDGVHAMPPTAGRGAATAMQDAAVLSEELGLAADGRKTVPVAVHDYEARMRVYAAEAIAASLRPVGWIRSGARPVGGIVTRLALPLAALAGSLSAAARRS